MNQKNLRIILLLVLLGLCGYFYLQTKSTDTLMISAKQVLGIIPTNSGQTTQTASSAGKLNNLRNLKAHLRDDVHLRPDQRFIIALSEIRRLAGIGEKAGPQLEIAENHWILRWDTGETLSMPLQPDFASAIEALRKHAQVIIPRLNLAPQAASSVAELPVSYQPTKLWEQLHQVEIEWLKPEHTSATLVQAAKAFARLSYMSIDSLEVSDRVQAKALAFLVLAQVASGDALLEEESQVASRMSYKSHALRLAAQLAEDNLWRLYLERKDEALAKAISAMPYKQKDSYLLLRRLADNNDIKAWVNVISRQESDPEDIFHELATSFSAKDFYPRNVISSNLHYLILSHLLKNQGSVPGAAMPPRIQAKLFEAKTYLLLANYFKGTNRTLVENFETWLQALAGQHTGPILNADLYRDFYRGYFFSALHHYADHLLNSFSSVEAAKRFLQVFSQTDQGIGKEFKTWFGHLVSAQEGAEGSGDLLGDLQNMSHLGVTAWQETWEAYLQRLPFGSPEAATATLTLIPRLDSRIDHRYLLANLLRSSRWDLVGSEAVYDSIVRDDPEGNRNLQIWFAAYGGDDKRLLELARNKDWLPSQRAKALSSIDSRQENQDVLRAAFKDLLADTPDSWQAVNSYSQFLGKNNQHSERIKMLDNWLQHNKDDFELDRLSAIVSLAESKLQQGEPELAWNTIKDSLDSMYGPILSKAVKIRLALNDFKQAEELAGIALHRYSSSLAHFLDLMDVYWASGQYDIAAQRLKSWPLPIGNEDWRWKVGEKFAERFVSKPVKETEAAFAELIKLGFEPINLEGLALALSDKGQAEAAFRTQTQLRVQGMGYGEILLNAYGYLEAWQGQTAAAAWLDKQLPPQMRNFMSLMYMRYKQNYPLLWSMIPNPESGQYPEAVWLYRAAAKVDGAVLTPEQDKALEQYYANNPGDFYGQLGQYLLGRLNAEQLLDKALPAGQICEAAFYFGLRAENEKHYTEAAEWYLTSIRTQLFKSGEYRWSFDRLYKWRNLNKSLKYIANQSR